MRAVKNAVIESSPTATPNWDMLNEKYRFGAEVGPISIAARTAGGRPPIRSPLSFRIRLLLKQVEPAIGATAAAGQLSARRTEIHICEHSLCPQCWRLLDFVPPVLLLLPPTPIVERRSWQTRN